MSDSFARRSSAPAEDSHVTGNLMYSILDETKRGYARRLIHRGTHFGDYSLDAGTQLIDL